MLFSETERRELAAFFAKRFSDPTIRSMLAKRAGVKEGEIDEDTDEAWDSLILLAQQRRKLAKLAQVAAKMDLGDQNLQAVCNLLGARARTVRNQALAGGMVAVVALSFGLGGWMLGAGDATDRSTPGIVYEADLAQAAATLPAPAPVEVPEAIEVEKVPTKALTPREARRLARAEARRNRPPTGPAWRNGRCTYDKPGQFIGYWYAGKEHPGQPGEVIDIGISVNVRRDYPNGKNGFNTKASVRCILRRGDVVKLTGAAIEVGRSHYWVPLYHGDLVTEAPQEIAAL